MASHRRFGDTPLRVTAHHRFMDAGFESPYPGEAIYFRKIKGTDVDLCCSLKVGVSISGVGGRVSLHHIKTLYQLLDLIEALEVRP